MDWTPPPKPIPDAASALDLSTTTHATHKPILKHRSISQLLTSDLGHHLSPPQSETSSDIDHDEYEASRASHAYSQHQGSSGSYQGSQRPPLTQTKSDTHIMRWGPSRTFRKESPPRIDPPAGAYSPTNLDAFFAASAASTSGSNSSTGGDTHRAPSPTKKRHISFNTFVEQCIAIEKPKVQYADDDDDDEDRDDDDEEGEDEFAHHHQGRYPYGRNAWGGYDDG